MKSKRYRKWRSFGLILISGLTGSLIGYYQEDLSFGRSSLTRLSVPAWFYPCATLGLMLVFAAIVAYYLRRVRQFYHQSELQSDEEDALIFEAKAHKAYVLAGIWTSVLVLPYFVVLIEMIADVKEKTMSPIFTFTYVLSTIIVVVASLRVRSGFKLLYGKGLPAYANTKEKQAFIMEQMDELERQINYEESFSLVKQMVRLVFPIIYMGLLILAMVSQMDVKLAFVMVSIVYLYLIIGQYRIAKRYYQ